MKHPIHPRFTSARTAIGILTAALLLCSCSPAGRSSSLSGGTESPDGAIAVLTIGTADSGGSMYPAGETIAEFIETASEHIHVNICASTGSYTNIQMLSDGQIDLGLVSGDAAYAAFYGTHEYSADPQTGLRAIGAVYSSISNWMALSSSSLFYVHDLKGIRVSVGPEASNTDLSARIVFDLFNITPENTEIETRGGIGYGAEQVLKGTLDAVHGFAGTPVEGLYDLSVQTPSRLLKYTASELNQILSENSFYYPATIPAGTYKGQAEDVDSFGVKCLVCVDEDMEEELVYELTSILYSSREALGEEQALLKPMSDDGFMYSELPIPLHPGAERFYREQGLIP
ncbi:tRAP transporter solute receptor TAXI family [Clostridium sp. CAG:149]|nr:tRAP transporter solute receptor TAXI family [Clostridium sp. CAG:149]